MSQKQGNKGTLSYNLVTKLYLSFLRSPESTDIQGFLTSGTIEWE